MERLIDDHRPPSGAGDDVSRPDIEPPMVAASRLVFDDVIRYTPFDVVKLRSLRASLPPGVMDGNWTKTVLEMREMDDR